MVDFSKEVVNQWCYSGSFIVAYAKMQKILFPEQDHELFKKHLSEKYSNFIAKQTLEFRRYFGLVSEYKENQEAQSKPNHPKSLFGDAKTPPKKVEPKPIDKERSVNLKRNPL